MTDQIPVHKPVLSYVLRLIYSLIKSTNQPKNGRRLKKLNSLITFVQLKDPITRIKVFCYVSGVVLFSSKYM